MSRIGSGFGIFKGGSSGGGASNNIYNTSDSLTGNRIVTFGGNSLEFAGADSKFSLSGKGGFGALTYYNYSLNGNAIPEEYFRWGASTNWYGITRTNGVTNRFSVYNTAENMRFSINTLVADATMSVKGEGSTSATTALLVENSLGTELFKILDNGIISGNIPNFANTDLTLNANRTHDLANYSLKFNNSLQANVDFTLSPNGSFNWSGQGAGNDFTLNTSSSKVLKITGGHSNAWLEAYSTTAGTSHIDFYSLTLSADNGARPAVKFFWHGSPAFYNSVKIGDSIAPTARLHVVGSGSTSATTTLLVENSLGEAILRAVDNNSIYSRGNGDLPTNTAFGEESGLALTGLNNTFYGYQTGKANNSGTGNSIFGTSAYRLGTAGINNTALGYQAMQNSSVVNENTAIGRRALIQLSTGDDNTALGSKAGDVVVGGGGNAIATQGTFLGSNTKPSASGNTNEIIVGYNTEGNGSNTATWGNTSIANHYFSGVLNGDGSGLTNIAADNFATTDLTLTGNRTHDLGGNNLTFITNVASGDEFRIQSDVASGSIRMKSDNIYSSIYGYSNVGLKMGREGFDHVVFSNSSGNEISSFKSGVTIIPTSSAGRSALAVRAGTGFVGTSKVLDVQGTGGSLGLVVDADRNMYLSGGSFGIGYSDATAPAKLTVKGSGSTSATTALLVENSLSTSLLEIDNAGNIGVGIAPSVGYRLYVNATGSGVLSNTNGANATAVFGQNLASTGTLNTGVIGSAGGSSPANTGVEGRALGTTTGTNLGGYFRASGGASNYAIRLVDGTEGLDKVLKSDANGYGTWDGQSEVLVIACSDETTDLTTGTAKVTFRMPYAMTLEDVRASVTTAPTGSTLTCDVNESGVSVLSTVISIDAGEKTSTTATTPPVISDSALADNAEITIDLDQIGSTVAGTGLKIYLIGKRA